MVEEYIIGYSLLFLKKIYYQCFLKVVIVMVTPLTSLVKVKIIKFISNRHGWGGRLL